MKKTQTLKLCGLAVAALLFGGANSALAQSTNYYVNAFTSAGNSAGTTPAGCGNWYSGTSALLWDPNTPDTLAGAGADSAYMYIDLDDQNCLTEFLTPPGGDNLWWDQSPVGVHISQYKAVHFDVLWDTVNSTVGINDFNNLSVWPTNLLM